MVITGLKVTNKKTGEYCEILQENKCTRWSNSGDFILEHLYDPPKESIWIDGLTNEKEIHYINKTWSFLCNENFFYRVVDFYDWELRCIYCGTWYTFEYFKNLSQLCDLCDKHGRTGF